MLHTSGSYYNRTNMIKKKMLTVLLVLLNSHVLFTQDFRYDHQCYETISWETFFERLNKNPNLVYFDIRSTGERGDSAEYPSMNQGKIRGAIEADYFDFESYYPIYKKYKADTIYLYCSHSRRTRLLAKQLYDSSFKHIVNVNGGLSYLNSLPKGQIPDREKYLTSHLQYGLLSPFDFIKCYNDKNFLLIDVRPDSLYYGKSGIEWENMFGNIKQALHIPLEKMKSSLASLDKSKRIFLFDNDGELAPACAELLISFGYQVDVVLFGLDNIVAFVPSNERKFLKTKYDLILPEQLLSRDHIENALLIDTRTETEFNSNDTADWKNMGRLREAINIPLTHLSPEKFQPYSGKKIILYDIMMHDELFEYAKKLDEFGITYSLLYGGMVQVNWEAYNTEKIELRELILR